MDWDYEKGLVHLSMAPYLKKALAQFGVEKPRKPVNSPYAHVAPQYGAKEQRLMTTVQAFYLAHL
jgi:hypothetical protein